MTPTFKMHGSKARTAPWLTTKFPSEFRRWIEPFAGRGNVFYRVHTSGLRFESARLNDIGTHEFLRALRDYSGDWSFVDPEPIDKEVHRRWRDSPTSQERSLAESYVARFGDTYACGPNTTCHRNRHSRTHTIKRMRTAGEILRERQTEVTGLDWAEFLEGVRPEREDLVYLDPPYNVKQTVHYAGIDHEKFLKVCQGLPSWVFISGYSSPLYESQLAGWRRETRQRSSTGKIATDGKKPKVEEVLWWRPPLPG